MGRKETAQLIFDPLVLGFTVNGVDYGVICKCGSYYVVENEDQAEIMCCKCRSTDKFSLTKAERVEELPVMSDLHGVGWNFGK